MANRSRRSRVAKLVAGLAAISLIAVACGGSDSDADVVGETTVPATTTTEADVNATTVPTTTAVSGGGGISEQKDLIRTIEGVQTGGTLRIGVEAETDGLNPTVNRFAAASYNMGYTVFEPLFAWDSTGQPVPYLAESSESSDDGLEFIIHLRPDILFSDGEPLNADAIVANFEALLLDPLISLAVRPALNLDNPIETVDELTVKFNLSLPNKQFATGLVGQLGMPGSPKWLAAAIDDPTLNQAPVGTGPFVIDSRTPDSSTKFVRNDNWWQTLQNATPVYLDAIEFFPNTDALTSASQLVAGDLDGFATTTPNAIATIRDEGDAFIRIDDDQGEESFAMMNTAQPPFDDIRVRQAITFATPRENYIEFVGAGILREADSMFAPELIWNNPDVVQEGDEPERSGPLVDAYCADFPENCDGGRINIDLQYSGPSVEQETIADILSAGWGDFFNVNRVVLLQDDHITNVALGVSQMVTWRQFGAPDPTADRVWLACDSIGFLSLNWPRFCDQEREDLLNQARETTDLDARAALWQEIQQKVHDDYLYIFFTHTLWMSAFDAKVRNECGVVSPDGAELLCTNNGSMFNHAMWIDQG